MRDARRARIASVLIALAAAACGSGSGADDTGGGGADGGASSDAGGLPNGDAGARDGSPGSDDASAEAGPCNPQPLPRCDAPPPDPGPRRPWVHTFSAVWATGFANHRGRDLFLVPGEAQWIIGKLAYGLNDKDIKDEDVDIWLNRGCATSWEKLATVRSTNDGAHATVEGVEDSGGRVYYQIPASKTLGPGRHRVRLVVAGDLTATELFLDVVPRNTPLFVSDVDGTLTTSETAEVPALLTGALPDAHPDAAAALTLLANRGYRAMYVTARPEQLVQRTRDFVAAKGFPPGIVHTTMSLTGANGSAAITYKTNELAMLAGKGLKPAWDFGNTETDAAAYENGGIQPKSHRIFFQFTDAAHGGRRIEAYSELLGEFGALPNVCP
jgi:hypothetical protein